MDDTDETWDRLRPDWLNPATVRGVAFVIGGLLALTVPDVSERIIGIIFVTILAIKGLTDLWAAWKKRPFDLYSLFVGLAWVAAAGVLILFTDKSKEVIPLIFGALVAFLGITIAVRAVRNRRSNPTWTFNLVRGGIYIASGVVIAVLPEAIGSSVLLAISIAAIAYGALMIAIGATSPDAGEIGPGELTDFARGWLADRDLGEEMRESVVDNLFFEPPQATQKKVGFWVLLVLSVTIATLGILADSTAVVIGAMLVAPLMTPIMAVSAGIVNGWVKRVSVAFATVAGGVVVSITVAWIVASWAPQLIPFESNSQILSRTSPTLIDMMIAVAAGAAGAYATIDRRVSSSITGVAIAVALVPPLGVVGVALRETAYSDAGGAFLLFLTNLVGIILMASVVFVIGGLAPVSSFRENREKMKTVVLTVILGAMIIIVPLAFTSEGILVSASRQGEAQRITSVWIEPVPTLRVNRVNVAGTEISVVVTGEGTLPSVAELEIRLEASFNDDVVVVVEFVPTERVTSDNQSGPTLDR
jgi:uncharacterized hydrophobic protein (TIGR00271 family)